MELWTHDKRKKLLVSVYGELEEIMDFAGLRVFYEEVDTNQPGCERYKEIIKKPSCVKSVVKLVSKGLD